MVNSQAPIPNIINSHQGIPKALDHQCEEKKVKGKAFSHGFTYKDTLQLAVDLLKKRGIDSFQLDAEVMLAHVSAMTRLELFLHRHQIHSQEVFAAYMALVARRLCHEPVAYLTGVKEFFGHEFIVSPDCLIPRPDTEIIVEQCLRVLPHDALDDEIIELCTGSGAIVVALLKERPRLRARASDISSAALLIAKKNALCHDVAKRAVFVEGDLFSPHDASHKARLIVANPPYIRQTALSTLSASVREYEPMIALDGKDAQGLYFYRRILQEAPAFLLPKGYLVLEIGFDQRDEILDLVGPLWQTAQIVKDLGQRDRCIVLQLRA